MSVSFLLLLTIFIIAVTQKLVLQQFKNVTSTYMATLSPPPAIQFSLGLNKERIKYRKGSIKERLEQGKNEE